MAVGGRIFRADPDEVEALVAARDGAARAWPVAQYDVWPTERSGRPVFVWDERELADWAATASTFPLPATDLSRLGDPLVWVVDFDEAPTRAAFAAHHGWDRSSSDDAGDDIDRVRVAATVPDLAAAGLGAEVSTRYADALAFASTVHAGQIRKGDGTPTLYLTHLVRVSARVLAHGGTEDQAIAALLHDAAEDQGGRPMLDLIGARYGATVAALVESCSDSLTGPDEAKLPWRDRKIHHVDALTRDDELTVLTVPITAADKLDNAVAMTERLDAIGPETWTRFKGGRVGTVWYQRAMHAAMRTHGVFGDLLDELDHQIDRLVDLAAHP